MKRIRIMIMAVLMTIVTSASAMNYSEARDYALYLTDKMAYELALTDEQYEMAYEINLDYLMNVDMPADLYGAYWDLRNRHLRYVLSAAQYDRMIATTYFYRPLSWSGRNWSIAVYNYYTSPSLYYRPAPKVYATYRGANRSRTGKVYVVKNRNSITASPRTTAQRTTTVFGNGNSSRSTGIRQFGNNASVTRTTGLNGSNRRYGNANTSSRTTALSVNSPSRAKANNVSSSPFGGSSWATVSKSSQSSASPFGGHR